MNYILFMIAVISIVLIVENNNSNSFVFAEVEIPTEYETFKDDEYGIEFEYPVGWVQFGDIALADYSTNIAIFAPLQEVKFKKFDSWKDYYKFDYRIIADLEYSYLIPKVNLYMVLDNKIGTILEGASGFKKMEILESTTKSKLDNNTAYEIHYQAKKKKDLFKYYEIGTIVEDNMILSLNFKSNAEDYDKLLPVFEHIKNSFKITNPDW